MTTHSLSHSARHTTHLLAPAHILNHILIRRLRCVDARLRSLDGEGETVHDDEGGPDYFALHEAHDFPGDAGAGVDHLGV